MFKELWKKSHSFGWNHILHNYIIIYILMIYIPNTEIFDNFEWTSWTFFKYIVNQDILKKKLEICVQIVKSSHLKEKIHCLR